MSDTDWTIVAALAFICAVMASHKLGAFKRTVERQFWLLSFVLLYAVCVLVVALGYFSVKSVVT